MKGNLRFANSLRHRFTDAERRLWSYLRDRRLMGFKCRRQHPIGRYIVDFCCLDQRLVIELDGGQHREQEEADTQRTNVLEKHVFRILRFWDNDALKTTDVVIRAIEEALIPLTPPSPRRYHRRGEGAEELPELFPR